MLKFYGIKFNQNGLPERFTLSFALSESLQAGLKISSYNDNDPDKTVKAIETEIEKLFHDSAIANNNKRFRFLVAKWFRTKDIVRFLFCDRLTAHLKLTIAKVLDTRLSIEEKWAKIESLLLEFVFTLEIDERNEQLSNQESSINLILQMVALFFLEQDEEMPPANLELQFIRGQFPRIIWKKRDGLSSYSNPFWLPKNTHCRSAFLLTRLISKIYAQSENTSNRLFSVRLLSDEKQQGNQRQPQKHDFVPISYHALLPEDPPDEIRLELDEEIDDNKQLSLVPESAAETFLSLQRMVQYKYSYDGVKHLLAIFRQLAGSSIDGHCLFDENKHLKLVARETKQGEFTPKQLDLFRQVYQVLVSIKVKRYWHKGEQAKETVNPFILELYTECPAQVNSLSVKTLLLDPLFLPGKGNPFHLGHHLHLIPDQLFRESIYKHSLLPALASYLAGTWLNEFVQTQGKISKTARQIVEGCILNLSHANKYRVIDKIKSELAYMEEKCYIAAYQCQPNEGGNPWDDLYQITAPHQVLAAINEKMQRVGTNCSSEKLIA